MDLKDHENKIKETIVNYPLIAKFLDIKGELFGGFVRSIIEGIDIEQYLNDGGDIDIFVNTNYWDWQTKDHAKFVEILKEVSKNGYIDYRGTNYTPCSNVNSVHKRTDNIQIMDKMSLPLANYIFWIPNGEKYIKYDVILRSGGSVMSTIHDYYINKCFVCKHNDQISLQVEPTAMENIKNKVLSPYSYQTGNYGLRVLYRAMKFYKKGYIPDSKFKTYWKDVIESFAENTEEEKTEVYVSTKQVEPLNPRIHRNIHFNASDLEILTLEKFFSDPTIQEIKEKYIDE